MIMKNNCARLWVVCWLLALGGAARAQFAQDSFFGTAGTLLSSRAPTKIIDDTASTGSWTLITGFTGSTVISSANTARGNTTSAQGGYVHSNTPTTADYYVQADFIHKSTLTNIETGIQLRALSSTKTGYLLTWQSTGVWTLYRGTGAGYTSIGSFNQTPTVGTHPIVLSAVGTAIKAYVDGTQIISVTDSNVTTAGLAGLYTQWIVGDTTGDHLDNFAAYNGGYGLVAATSYALSGTLSATLGTPSTLTLTTNGTLAAATTVTVMVSTGAATLNGASLTTVNVVLPINTVGNSTITFTTQSATAGSSTLHFTNGGGLTNQADATFAAGSGPVVVTPADVNWYFPPYTWYSDGMGIQQANNINGGSTFAESVNGGCFTYVAVTGTTQAVLSYSTGDINGGLHKLRVSIDGGLWTTFAPSATGATTQTLFTGLSTAAHTIWLYDSFLPAGVNRWNLTDNLKIASLTLDAGGATTVWTGTSTSVNILVFGDSIVDNANQDPFGNANTADSLMAFPVALAWDMGGGYSYGQIGFPGTGYKTTANNVPVFSSTWDHYSSGRSRLVAGKFSPMPSFVFVCHGRNDSGLSATVDVAPQMALIRAALNPNVPIFVCANFAGGNSTTATNTAVVNIRAGINGATQDSYVWALDLGAAGSEGLVGTASRFAPVDGIHPNWLRGPQLGAMLAKQAQQKLSGINRPSRPGTNGGAGN